MAEIKEFKKEKKSKAEIKKAIMGLFMSKKYNMPTNRHFSRETQARLIDDIIKLMEVV